MNTLFSAFLEKVLSRISNIKLRQNILQSFPYWIASIITGLVAVFYAKLFAIAEHFAIFSAHNLGFWMFLVSPLCFVTAWWLVKRFAENAKGSGIPQVMAAIELATPRQSQNIDAFLSLKTGVIKIISSTIMVLGGGAIGREGPTIQIAGCIFWKINQLLPGNWPKISRKNMIITGAAAGLAAAFNTPLGGIVFAVEELAKTHISLFKSAVFTAVIIAGLTAQQILGPYLYLGFPAIDTPSVHLFPFVIIVAIAGGAFGTMMCKVILKILEWKKQPMFKRYEIVYVIGVGLLIAMVSCFFSTDIMGSGKEQMSGLLFTDHKYGGWNLVLIRTFGPILSFTTGASGGVFAPALSAGAALGSVFAELFRLGGSDANMLMLAGMVAFLTGVTRSPFTSAILVLEMTNRQNITIHLMMAGIVSTLIANFIDRHSFYGRLEQSYLKEIYDKQPKIADPI